MAKKNVAAVELAKRRMTAMTKDERAEVARQGGLVGGKARAETLTAKQRSESARKAAQARWGKKGAKKEAEGKAKK